MKKISLLVVLLAALNLKGASSSDLAKNLTTLSMTQKVNQKLGIKPETIEAVNKFLHDGTDENKVWKEPLASITGQDSDRAMTKFCYTKKDTREQIEILLNAGPIGEMMLLITIHNIYQSAIKNAD